MEIIPAIFILAVAIGAVIGIWLVAEGIIKEE
jgi:uncharacterized membrane protein